MVFSHEVCEYHTWNLEAHMILSYFEIKHLHCFHCIRQEDVKQINELGLCQRLRAFL